MISELYDTLKQINEQTFLNFPFPILCPYSAFCFLFYQMTSWVTGEIIIVWISPFKQK